MARLSLENLHKTYEDGTSVIHGIDLEVNDGEFMVFVGPSGCGKSTTLRMIAGLEDPSSGNIRIGENLVNEVSPSMRGIAMVFQSYALYPHMTVRENMAFGLKLAKVSKAQIVENVERAAQTLQISHLLDKKPKALSGGQRQRVAIGRAIVRQPKVFLFDEPLSNLDAALRVQMRIELARLHKALGVTMIYVTHDQVEAMTLGDRIAVFNGGRIEQIGTPLDLYEKPCNIFVAGFLGSPKMNFISAKVIDQTDVATEFQLANGTKIKLTKSLSVKIGTEVTLGLRPESITWNSEPSENTIPAKALLTEHLGNEQIVYAEIDSVASSVALKLSSNEQAPKTGRSFWLAPSIAAYHVFDDSGKALT